MTASPNDFDFLQGTWTVANRRLKDRLAGSDDWEEFPARQVFWRLLDGVANVDEFDCPALGVKGVSVRTLDLARGHWSIYWIGSNDGVLQPPVHGSFADGRGEFLGDDTFRGQPIKVRFRWTVSPTAPVWEQAFSADGGQSWETNWIMRFARETPAVGQAQAYRATKLRRMRAGVGSSSPATASVSAWAASGGK